VRTFLSLILVVLCSAGCRGVPVPPPGMTEPQALQTIANALPELSFGSAEPPGIIYMTRSRSIPARGSGGPMKISADETGFSVRINSLIPRVFRLSYGAIADVEVSGPFFRNAMFFPTLFILQSWELRLAIDSEKAPEIRRQVLQDIKTLRSLAREKRLPQPYYYSEELQSRLDLGAERWGGKRIELVASYTGFGAPFVPTPGKSMRVAEAFMWASENAKRKD